MGRDFKIILKTSVIVEKVETFDSILDTLFSGWTMPLNTFYPEFYGGGNERIQVPIPVSFSAVFVY